MNTTQTQTDRGLNTHSNAIITPTPRNTMNRFSIAPIVFAMALTGITGITSLAGCENENAGPNHVTDPVSMCMELPEVCKTNGEAFCESMCVTMTMDMGDEKPYEDTQCFERDVTTTNEGGGGQGGSAGQGGNTGGTGGSAGQGGDTGGTGGSAGQGGQSSGDMHPCVDFAPLPNDKGHKLVVNINVDNISVPPGFEIWNTNGQPFEKEHTLLPLEGREKHLIEARLVDTNVGTTADPGKGHICVKVSPDGKICVVSVDGKLVEFTEDADKCPEGVLVSDQDVGNSTVKVECPDGYEGEEDVKVKKDEVSTVEVEVTKVTTSLCYYFSTQGSGVVNPANCSITDQKSGKLASATAPAGLCESTEALYFPSVEHGDRLLHVKCDEGESADKAYLNENEFNEKWIQFEKGGDPGDTCYTVNGDNVNKAMLARHLQKRAGHNDGNGQCQLESQSTDYANWSVTSVTDNGDCNAFGDPACLIALQGTINDPPDSEGNYGHLTVGTTQQQLDTVPQNTPVLYYLTVDDGNGKSFVLTIHLVNDVVSEQP